MGKSKDLEARLSRLRGSLEELGEKLGTTGERVKEQVGAGVDRAMRWSEFAHAVAPVVEAAPGHTMDAADVERALDDASNDASEVVEARRRRDAFIAAHGRDVWRQCLEEAGTLRIDRRGGHTTVTRVTT